MDETSERLSMDPRNWLALHAVSIERTLAGPTPRIDAHLVCLVADPKKSPS
jgi:hypothetical protein